MSAVARPDRRFRHIAIGVGLAAAALVLIANAHLVYVAFSSQPDCVSHLKATGAPGAYRAAESSC